jgi:ABC-type transport system substrate-binding protein
MPRLRNEGCGLQDAEIHRLLHDPEWVHDGVRRTSMKIFAASLAAEWVSIYFGGQYHVPGDPKFKADVPWNDRPVRQAMNMAINRQELQVHLFSRQEVA